MVFEPVQQQVQQQVATTATPTNVKQKKYEDTLWEEQLERALNEVEGYLSPYLEEVAIDIPRWLKNLIHVTMVNLVNFFNKYADEETARIVRVYASQVDGDNDTWSASRHCIGLNEYCFARFRGLLGFGLEENEKKPWRQKFIKGLQIDDKLKWDSPVFETPFYSTGDNQKIKQMAHIFNRYIENDNDLLFIISGFRRSGKSTIAVEFLIEMKRDEEKR